MVVHQQDQHLAFARIELKTARDPLRKNRARFRMRAGAHRFAGVVQQQSQVKHERIGQFLEKFPVLDQLAIFRLRQRIEFVDTDQSVFVRSVAVEKFMLHQTGELAELGNVLPEKIQPVHQAQGASDLSFAR